MSTRRCRMRGTHRGHGFCPISALAQLAEPHHERHLKHQRSSCRIEVISRVCLREGWQGSAPTLRRWLLRAKWRGPTAGSCGTCTRKECAVTGATARPSVICLAIRRRGSERCSKIGKHADPEQRNGGSDSLCCVDIASMSRRAIR